MDVLTDAVSVLLCGPMQRVQVWAQALTADERFHVISLATTPEDYEAKLGLAPDAVVVDAAIFTPQVLLKALRKTPGVAYVILPPLQGEVLLRAREQIAAIEQVKDVYSVDVNLAVLRERMAGDVQRMRQVRGAEAPGADLWSSPFVARAMPVPTQVVAVWNQIGGVGKTTVSTNLAYEIAQRGYKTLLIGLGAPDDLPLVMGLKVEPNITYWLANPTPEGLRLAVQELDTLDVLAGFPDVMSESQAMSIEPEAPNSIRRLVETAMHQQYAVIVIDAPPSATAAAAIMASNALALVGRPSLEGVWRTVEAYRTITERMAGVHRIPPERVYVVLNRIQDGHRLSAKEWHRLASRHLGRTFPPVIAQIPDDVAVGDVQDQRRIPAAENERFRSALAPLVDVLASRTDGAAQRNGKKKPFWKVWR